MNDSEINDVREVSDFKGVTFSKYKKGDVKKELLNSLCDNKLENACNWSAEFICSAHYIELWDTIILYYSKHIHLGNPNLIPYIEKRIENFKEIMRNGYIGNELALRNNAKIRMLFAEIMCVLCDTDKKHSINEIKVDGRYFDVTNLTEKMKAPNVNYAVKHMKENDPKEFFIAINELSYHLSEHSKNTVMACFWIEWIMEFSRLRGVKKQPCLCERRVFAKVDNKYQTDVAWLVWSILLDISGEKDKRIHRCISALVSLYSLKYTSNVYKKRRFVVYCGVSLITENVEFPTNIVKYDTQKKIKSVTSKIDSIYKAIKINEEAPNMDYMFSNVKQKNLEKSIAKIDRMNEIGTNFVPRL